MFGNTPPMTVYDTGDRYKDTIDAQLDYMEPYTSYYVCGEDTESEELARIQVRYLQ